jgi:helix-turn-helix protein
MKNSRVPQYMTPKQAAGTLSVDVSRIYQLKKAGRLETNGTGELVSEASVMKYKETRDPEKVSAGKLGAEARHATIPADAMTRASAAKALNVSREWVRRLIDQGVLKAEGRRVSMESVEKYRKTRHAHRSKAGKTGAKSREENFKTRCKLAILSVRQGLTTERLALEYIAKHLKSER